MSILKKVVSRKTEKVHVLEDNYQLNKIMDQTVVCLTSIHCHSLTTVNYV